MSKRCLVVVPMKDPAASKTRLSDTLDGAKRADLARLLLKRTLRLLSELRGEAGFDLAVVTGSPEVAGVARAFDAALIAEPDGGGLNAALGAAAGFAIAQGYDALCVLPADLVTPDEADLLRLINLADSDTTAVICPAVDGGTNALCLSPPDGMRFCFGPGSARRHTQAAERARLTPVVLPLESLRYDIDTSADLALAMRRAPDLRAI